MPGSVVPLAMFLKGMKETKGLKVAQGMKGEKGMSKKMAWMQWINQKKTRSKNYGKNVKIDIFEPSAFQIYIYNTF